LLSRGIDWFGRTGTEYVLFIPRFYSFVLYIIFILFQRQTRFSARSDMSHKCTRRTVDINSDKTCHVFGISL
jgi:hypothetical protein